MDDRLLDFVDDLINAVVTLGCSGGIRDGMTIISKPMHTEEVVLGCVT